MKKEKLLEIYNKFQEEVLDVSLIRQLRKYSDHDLDIIINSTYPKIMLNIIINYEFSLLNLNEQREIINLINNAKTEEIANNIYRVVASRIALSSGLVIQIANIINESTIESSRFITDLALTNSVLINPNLLDIMKMIGLSQSEEQARVASDIAKSIEVLLNKDLLNIIQIAINTQENKCKLVNAIAKNREVLSSKMIVEILNLVNKVDIDKEQIELITNIASNKLLEKHKRALEYIIKMLASPQKIMSIYNHAQTEIGLLKQYESKLKKDNELFWNFYRETPATAIEILQNSKSIEITSYTRVRKRNENNE